MLSPVFILLAVTLAVRADELALRLLNGPCPEPPKAVQNLSRSELSGRWYGRSSNIELDDGGERWRCLQFNLQLEENNILEAEVRFITSKGQQTVVKRYTPIEDEPGVFLQNVRDESGSWVNNGWHYRVVALEDGNVLQYSCKSIGDQHISYYYVMSRNQLPNEIDREVQNRLEQQVRDNRDEREMISYDQQNCQD